MKKIKEKGTGKKVFTCHPQHLEPSQKVHSPASPLIHLR